MPLPLESMGARGGGEGIFRTEGRRDSSRRSFPEWMGRRRRVEEEGGREVRMRCLRAMTVVEDGLGISRRRSGIAVVKRIVRLRGLGVGGGLPGRGSGDGDAMIEVS